MIPETWSWAKFLEGMDDQRVERLKQCDVLRQILDECQAGTHGRAQLEEVPMGIRSVRYFHWRDNIVEDSCVREEHALWACRATAVKCGGELVKLRDCFEELSPERVLEGRHTAYEKSHEKGHLDIPCQTLQKNLGDCIIKHTQELHERLKKRTPQS